MVLSVKKSLVILIAAVSLGSAQEKPQKCWIYFRDKDASVLNALSKHATDREIFQATGITQRALARRAKVLPTDQRVAAEDLPVSQSYIHRLENSGVSVINTSRWFNAVTALLTDDQRMRIASLPFVERVERVRTFIRKNEQHLQIPFLQKSAASPLQQLHDYGLSLAQVTQINVVNVHNLRITGRGVLVGMLDDGFRWRIHEATKHMNVIKEYDFIQHDSVTSNEPGKSPVDSDDQDQHGTITMSTVGGYFEGKLVSPAFGASFILSKTEYVPSETNIEEDNWVAGIEWEEQNGVDVVSSSLGYSEFDAVDSLGNPQHSYTYADMNGRTATTSKAAVLAARRGVVVCSAMGNEGQTSWHYLTTPADADSIISVGAVNPSGTVAAFSSVGPTSDGRTKPDVVAEGVSAYAATSDVFANPGASNLYGSYSGTSLSTPLVAGAAALVLSAHPELTPMQVINALRNTASNASSPNNTIGWGVVNTYQAMLYYGLVLSTDPEITLTSDNNTSVGVFVVSHAPVKKNAVTLYYSINGGTTLTSLPMTLTEVVDSTTNSGKYTAIIPGQSAGTEVKFYVSADDSTNTPRTTPYGAPTMLFTFDGGVSPATPPPASFELYQNYPNPFNPATHVQFSIADARFVSLKIYDVLGKEIATLVHQNLSPGNFTVQWDGTGYPTGVYFYRLSAGSFSESKKMLLLK